MAIHVLPEKNPVDNCNKQWLQVSAINFKISILYVFTTLKGQVVLILVWTALEDTLYNSQADVVRNVGAGAISNEHRDLVECAVVFIETG